MTKKGGKKKKKKKKRVEINLVFTRSFNKNKIC